MRTKSVTTTAAIAVMTLTMTACDLGPSEPTAVGAHGPAATRVTWSPPKVQASASLACQDFGVWYLSLGGPAFASTRNLGTLARAKAEAPAGGRLHHDLSALVTEVIAVQAPQPGRASGASSASSASGAHGGRLLMQTAAYAVERDCVVVNSSSFPL